MVLGFAGSRTGEHIGAFFTARTATGSMLPNPVLLQAGRHYYDGNVWGDYAATGEDPDDVTFWTIQEYPETPPQESHLVELAITKYVFLRSTEIN